MLEILFNKEMNKSLALDNNSVIGECEYGFTDNEWNIIHTNVDSKYQGQGIARMLVEKVIEEANKLNVKVVADCSYAKKIIDNINLENSVDVDLILKDVENKLSINTSECNIHYFTDGVSGSVVFSINDKYLVKTVDELTCKVQEEFLSIYKSDHFQRIVYLNKELSYICFEFVVGERFASLKEIDIKDIISQIYNIVSNYKKYDYDGYGYLFEDYEKSWYQFLLDEVNYSKEAILDVDFEKVTIALNVIKKFEVDKYLIHGDFGVHNFLMDGKDVKVIDPMGVVGDYLYDFYFAIFSSTLLFTKVDLDYILSFYDRELEYKRALLLVVFYIRMSRSFKYDKSNYDKYLQLYNLMY